MTEDELRAAIFRGRRITRDPGLLAILDQVESWLDAPPEQRRPSLKFRGRHHPDTSNDQRIRKAQYMKLFMRKYRARKKAEKKAEKLSREAQERHQERQQETSSAGVLD